jgi:hypothetical protein
VAAILVATIMYFPIQIGTAVLRAIFRDLRHSSEIVPRMVSGLVFLLNIGFPAALVVGPVIYNWAEHPLASVAYAATLAFLYSLQLKRTRPRTPTLPVVERLEHTPGRNGVGQTGNTDSGVQEPTRCPSCGGPLSNRVCWSCGRRA